MLNYSVCKTVLQRNDAYICVNKRGSNTFFYKIKKYYSSLLYLIIIKTLHNVYVLISYEYVETTKTWLHYCRTEKDKQQLILEIDSISTQLDSALKAKVSLAKSCEISSHQSRHGSTKTHTISF